MAPKHLRAGDEVAAVRGKRVRAGAVQYRVDFKGGRRRPHWIELAELSACLHMVQEYELRAAAEAEGQRPPAGEDKATQTAPAKGDERTVTHRRRSEPWQCPVCFERRADLCAAGVQICTLRCGHLLCGHCVQLASVPAPVPSLSVNVAHRRRVRRPTPTDDRRIVTCPVCRASCRLSAGVHPVYIK